MADIKSGDKVKLNRTLSYKKVVMKNGEIEKESIESWDKGTIHAVKAVFGEQLVMLEDISAMVPISYVEKIEEYYTGKVVCISSEACHSKSFVNGKVYDVQNGIIIFENGTGDEYRGRRFNSLNDLNSIDKVKFIEVKNPEVLKEETYYNGKVICIDSHGKDTIWTKGKIYKFENGRTLCDNGTVIPYESRMPIKTFNELNIRIIADFIEIKE